MIAWPTIHCSWQLLREGWLWLFSGPYQPPTEPMTEVSAEPEEALTGNAFFRYYGDPLINPPPKILDVGSYLFGGPYQPPPELTIAPPAEPEVLPIADLPVVVMPEIFCAGTAPIRVPALKKLAIGVGPHPLDGWVNVDLAPHSSEVIRMDATKRFPYLNDTFSHVFSEHMIEHVDLDGARNMIRECYRVLRPGGRIRIVTPDREFLTALEKWPLSKLQSDYINWSCEHFAPGVMPSGAVVAEFFPLLWGHQHIFDRAELWGLMYNSGFTDPIMCELRESPDPELCDLENESRMPPGFLRLESMTIEAVKPNA